MTPEQPKNKQYANATCAWAFHSGICMSGSILENSERVSNIYSE